MDKPSEINDSMKRQKLESLKAICTDPNEKIVVKQRMAQEVLETNWFARYPAITDVCLAIKVQHSHRLIEQLASKITDFYAVEHCIDHNDGLMAFTLTNKLYNEIGYTDFDYGSLTKEQRETLKKYNHFAKELLSIIESELDENDYR